MSASRPRRRRGAARRGAAKPRRAASPKHASAPKRSASRRRSASSARAAKPKRAGAGAGAARTGTVRRKRATGTKRASRRPALRVVPRPKLPRATSFPQRAGASGKQSLLFELMRSRAALGAAIQGLSGGSAGEAIARGKWSARQIVLHLGHWDRETLRAVEAALRGHVPEWMAWGEEEDAVANRDSLAALEHHDWDGALRLLHASRAELLEAVESVPEEPAEVWSREHAFGKILWSSVHHDRHHAEAIKRWRAGRAK